MQHGRPLAKEENPSRPLSEEGRKDVERVARFLGDSGITVERAYHSGKVRARETAEIMISRLNPSLKPEERRGLSPLDGVNDIAEEIAGLDRDALIAGHLPHLGRLVSLIVTGDESLPTVRFQQGGVVCLERGTDGQWAVAWMVVPEIL